MESDRVEAVVTSGPKEKLILARGDVDHLLEARLLFWGSTTSKIKCTKRVPTGDLATDEKVVLSHLGSALSDSGSPGGHGVDGDLSRFIDTNGIEIERFDGETRELDKPLQDSRLPFPKTVLDGSELCELTHPVRMDTESLEISILVKVRSLTSIARGGDVAAAQDVTILKIESGEDAGEVP
jgi:hypothetical protein